MCGILGIISQKFVADRSWFERASLSIYHRGPDSTGSWWSENGQIGFSHRRLAIIDLSPGGNQPMQNGLKDIVITFNGEIYNYKQLREELKNKGHNFNTASDTEVIMAAYKQWGINCVSHFNGMFVFALYDIEKKQVMLARDRAGEKPLYYSFIDGDFRFASELKALMADESFPRQLNYSAVDCFLAMGYIPGELSILEGVNKLPPAHILVFDLKKGSIQLSRYWDVPEYKYEERSDVSFLDEIENLLEDSVKLQMVADVPVGILLSGGVDSSLVTAMAVRSASKIKTFTIVFPGHKKQDESEHALLIANHFETEHIELSAIDASSDLLHTMAQQFDEPMADSSMIPTYLVSKLIRQHCTVALGGDGGDELFGGYPHYSRLMWMNQKLKLIPRIFRSSIASVVPALLPTGFKGRNWLQALGTDFTNEVPFTASFFDKKDRSLLMNGNSKWHSEAEKIRNSRMPQNGDFLWNLTKMDFENYLAEDILTKVDRSSMLNSLEVRAPFLDYRIIEFAYGKLPTYLKTNPSNRKIVLKQLCERVLPKGFNSVRKQGFEVPLQSWLRKGPWNELFNDVLLSSDSFFNRKFTRALLEEQKKGFHNSERLYALVLFELWKKCYNVKS